MSGISSHLRAEASPFFPSETGNHKEAVMNQFRQWNFQKKDQVLVDRVLSEWYSAGTLDNILAQWEVVKSKEIKEQQGSLNILCYNVRGWGVRSLEVIDMVYKLEADICVCTEVGELWNKNTIPHYSNFHQKGTNKNGGVCVSIGKHLKGTRINLDVRNVVIVDVSGLSASVRIIAVYWPSGQRNFLKELDPYIIENTIITGDFNAAVKEYDSDKTDTRGRYLKEWVEKNNLDYIATTTHSSKRSTRNIDLTFTNIGRKRNDILHIGTSDHWPMLITCEDVSFEKNSMFQYVNWKVYEAILTLLEEYWVREQNIGSSADNWYMNYVRFLSSLKIRLTKWKEKEKFRPALPNYLIEKLKEVKRVRNKYYHERDNENSDGTRVLLRVLNREVKIEIAKYKSSKWQEFLTKIQETHDNKEKAFWLHLSRVYKPKSLPFMKLDTGETILTKENEISSELYRYYSQQFKEQDINWSDSHEAEIESEYLELMNQLNRSNVKIEPTNVLEIKKYIKKLKPKKSAGFDTVSNFMIKKISPGYINCLVNCFNTWIKSHKFPEFWKIAKIVTLNKLKSGVPRCDQTRPISLLATHSKLFEKLMLDRVRYWAEANKLVPSEQSGFRPGGLLPTRVLSIYQEIKNNMSANRPTLAIYVDYQKAYDKVWHKGLIVKLYRLGIPLGLLKLIVSWLNSRRAYVNFGGSNSTVFCTHIGLPQGSSLSPYLFIVYHSDLINYLGAHSSHIFADDLTVLISPPLCRKLRPMVKYLEKEGTKVCKEISQYSEKWKQPINVSKTVVQVFHTKIQNTRKGIYMQGKKLVQVKEFKYLGFIWTSRMSLKPTIDKALENIQRTFTKLKWIKSGKSLSKEVLRKCFFTYSFPYFAWIFPIFPMLPKTQKELLLRKFRKGLRLVHRCPFVKARHLFETTNETHLEVYVKRYIQKRLNKIEKTDLGRSTFYDDVFYWDSFHKSKNDHVGHFFRLKRVKLLKERHQCLLLKWLEFLYM